MIYKYFHVDVKKLFKKPYNIHHIEKNILNKNALKIKISDLTNNFERKIILYNKYKNRK